jgi:predicted transcriptional regulator
MAPDEALEPRRCESCETLAFGTGDVHCCDGQMTSVDNVDSVPEPTLEELLRTVFGMSESELEICLCVMEGGDLTAQELADQINYDRSVISRHLNHLADLGVVDKQRRIIKQGGYTYVYQPVSPEVVRERLTAAFASWVRDATEELQDLRREKVESIATTDEDPAWKIFRES